MQKDNAFVTVSIGCLTCVRIWVTIGEQVKKCRLPPVTDDFGLAHLALAVQVSAEGTKIEGFQEKLSCIGQWLPPLGMLQVRPALNHLSFAYLHLTRFL